MFKCLYYCHLFFFFVSVRTPAFGGFFLFFISLFVFSKHWLADKKLPFRGCTTGTEWISNLCGDFFLSSPNYYSFASAAIKFEQKRISMHAPSLAASTSFCASEDRTLEFRPQKLCLPKGGRTLLSFYTCHLYVAVPCINKWFVYQ